MMPISFSNPTATLYNAFSVSTIVLSVVGIAASIFATQPYLAIGFALMGVATFVIWKWGATNLGQITTLENKMNTTLQTLKERDRQIEETNSIFIQEKKELQGTNQELNKNLLGIAEEKKALAEELNLIKEMNNKTEAELKELSLSKNALHQELSQLKHTMMQLSKESSALGLSLDEEDKETDETINEMKNFMNQLSQKKQALIDEEKKYVQILKDLESRESNIQEATKELELKLNEFTQKMNGYASIEELNDTILDRKELLEYLENLIQNKAKELGESA